MGVVCAGGFTTERLRHRRHAVGQPRARKPFTSRDASHKRVDDAAKHGAFCPRWRGGVSGDRLRHRKCLSGTYLGIASRARIAHHFIVVVSVGRRVHRGCLYRSGHRTHHA